MSQAKYPLLTNAFSKQDLSEAIKVIKTGQITMSKVTKNFEQKFAKFVGAKYALMVNSGSSANLLSVYAACSPYRKKNLRGMMKLLYPLCVGQHHYGHLFKLD